MTVTVTAPGGYSVSKTVTVAGSVSLPYSDNSRALIPGMFVDLLVDIDGKTVRNHPDTYGEILLGAGAAEYLQLTPDRRVLVLSPCRTAITVKGMTAAQHTSRWSPRRHREV